MYDDIYRSICPVCGRLADAHLYDDEAIARIVEHEKHCTKAKHVCKVIRVRLEKKTLQQTSEEVFRASRENDRYGQLCLWSSRYYGSKKGSPHIEQDFKTGSEYYAVNYIEGERDAKDVLQELFAYAKQQESKQ